MCVITDLGRRCHPLCLVCSGDRADGLGLVFRPLDDGSMVAEFECSPAFQGYPDRLHGGVVAMLLDAGMTHCLFARGVAGLTAKLSIRYTQGVVLGTSAEIRARVVECQGPLYYLASEVMQNGRVCAAAKATFWDSACGEPLEVKAAEEGEGSGRRHAPAAVRTGTAPS